MPWRDHIRGNAVNQNLTPSVIGSNEREWGNRISDLGTSAARSKEDTNEREGGWVELDWKSRGRADTPRIGLRSGASGGVGVLGLVSYRFTPNSERYIHSSGVPE